MKRTLLFVAVVFCFFSMIGAVTLATLQPATHGWVANANSADLSGCETIVAAVASTQIIVDYVEINTDTALNVTLGEGETAGAITTVKFGPYYLAANSTIIVPLPPGGIILTSATALTVDASGAGNVTITAWGRYK
jgi:hypothetical protein